jgi:hypothetical protein
MLALSHIGQEDHDAMAGLFFVAMIMGGLAVGFLAAILTANKRNQGGDQPR